MFRDTWRLSKELFVSFSFVGPLFYLFFIHWVIFYCLLVVILNELYSFMLINKDASTI